MIKHRPNYDTTRLQPFTIAGRKEAIERQKSQCSQRTRGCSIFTCTHPIPKGTISFKVAAKWRDTLARRSSASSLEARRRAVMAGLCALFAFLYPRILRRMCAYRACAVFTPCRGVGVNYSVAGSKVCRLRHFFTRWGSTVNGSDDRVLSLSGKCWSLEVVKFISFNIISRRYFAITNFLLRITTKVIS